MLVDLSDLRAVGLSSLTWFVVSLTVGIRATRWSPERLDHTGPVTTLRAWEHDGAFWQKYLRVRRWKDLVPEAGGLFGDYSKRHIRSRDTDGLVHFRRETVRAERVHWQILATTPVHLIWCRPAIAVGMVVFGVLANGPCIVIQRDNRGRIDRVIARRARRRRGSPPRAGDATAAPTDLAQHQDLHSGQDEHRDEEADEQRPQRCRGTEPSDPTSE